MNSEDVYRLEDAAFERGEFKQGQLYREIADDMQALEKNEDALEEVEVLQDQVYDLEGELQEREDTIENLRCDLEERETEIKSNRERIAELEEQLRKVTNG